MSSPTGWSSVCWASAVAAVTSMMAKANALMRMMTPSLLLAPTAKNRIETLRCGHARLSAAVEDQVLREELEAVEREIVRHRGRDLDEPETRERQSLGLHRHQQVRPQDVDQDGGRAVRERGLREADRQQAEQTRFGVLAPD